MRSMRRLALGVAQYPFYGPSVQEELRTCGARYHCARAAGANLVGILLLDKTANVSIATSSSATNVKLTTSAVIVVTGNGSQDPEVCGPDSVLSRGTLKQSDVKQYRQAECAFTPARKEPCLPRIFRSAGGPRWKTPSRGTCAARRASRHIRDAGQDRPSAREQWRPA